MKEFKRHRSKGEEALRFALGVLGTVALAAGAALAARAAWGMYGKLAEASASEAASKSELSSLQAQQAGVSGALLELSSARGVEAQVRQRYGLARPGEGEIDIVESPQDASNASSTPPMSMFERIFHALFVW